MAKTMAKTQDDFPSGVLALQHALQQGKLSALEASEYYLKKIAERDQTLNSFITVSDELALQLARESDQRRANKQILGPLDGIPIALKDNIDLAGVVSSAGIGAYRHKKATSDASVVALLRAAGAVFLGKTNMHEAALGATTDNPHFGACHNPQRHGYTPGGSSGGSAAALVAGLCGAALGTDTLGSVRVPASYCGCFGFKASCGVISNHGVVPLSWTLDHVGPLVTSIEDLYPLLDVVVQYDEKDAYAWHYDQSFTRSSNNTRLSSTCCARIKNLDDQVEIDAEVAEAFDMFCEQLQAQNITIKEVDIEDYDFSRMRRCGLLISEAEASVVHGQAMLNQAEGFSESLQTMLQWGSQQTAQRLAKAYHSINQVKVFARSLFSKIDILLLPTTPQTAFPFEQTVPVNQADLTSFANLAQCPALSMPIANNKTDLPIGVQMISAFGEDVQLLQFASAVQKLQD